MTASSIKKELEKYIHYYNMKRIKAKLKGMSPIQYRTHAHRVSRRRIDRLMHELGLVSNYTVAQFKPHKSRCNEAPVKNELKRAFNQDEELAVIVSDLTYVRVGKKSGIMYAYLSTCLIVKLSVIVPAKIKRLG